MFNDAVIHVRHIESAVRAGGEIDRAKEFVGRGEEFALVVRVLSGDDAVLFRENISADDIRGGFADKGVAVKLLRERIAAIDAGAAGRGEF
jgi:hypothetical protein